MFTYIDPGHKQTHNTFLVTSWESKSGIVACGVGKGLHFYSELFRVRWVWELEPGQL